MIYHNFAYGFEWRNFEHLPIAAVILDTIALNLRWSPEYFAEKIAPLRQLRRFDGPKIAMPQDEFVHTDVLAEFLSEIGCTHVLSAASSVDADKIYRKRLPNAVLMQKLTGYLEQSTLSRIESMRQENIARDIDVGYRAWHAEPWLGEHGLLKLKLAQEATKVAARRPDIAFDVSTDEKAMFMGDDWYRFLLRCKTTLGVEGGASLLDRDGSALTRTRAYLSQHPDATFEEVRDACFPGQDNSLALFALGPRHLEACATRTCQLLVEGEYQGVLRAGIDYLPIARDFSDLEEVCERARDEAECKRIADNAWQRVVGSGQYTYRGFVHSVENDIIVPSLRRQRVSIADSYRIARAIRRHAISWKFARYEANELLPNRLDYEQSTDERWVEARRNAANIAARAQIDISLT
ncbi:hypothetical protein [Paraburkholderia sp. GAS334]|uniref:hypothetical protein n=1 Tax=Paraburkholderia sp. GAS334 TaxID=3035131 RepID=UPI003D21AFCF